MSLQSFNPQESIFDHMGVYTDGTIDPHPLMEQPEQSEQPSRPITTDSAQLSQTNHRSSFSPVHSHLTYDAKTPVRTKQVKGTNRAKSPKVADADRKGRGSSSRRRRLSRKTQELNSNEHMNVPDKNKPHKRWSPYRHEYKALGEKQKTYEIKVRTSCADNGLVLRVAVNM
ncbi:hypothetical protein BC939DRAFT_438723 [Gamsiella multidivaricata]|uniref:uncharacterized protein n=1 Tax=Gamsiella multidivaricata TaxID=101098 RepID=UPI00221F699F|nr:uncharacterized protein BC939DRAFT_438723 [Gamsiella multidivaricata]KAG0365129.1 hypothetical protein BGZ54_006846 [Gamsiella multidivaricata]KAI7830679.1 hypothetical protein BC939DRAFT_438723 [Gamsiella multidivaricata]